MAHAVVEVMQAIEPFVDDLKELDPVIYHELTDYGWRGITQQGEVLEVKSANGHAIEVPSEFIVSHAGRPIGRRKITNEITVDIDSYLLHFNRVVAAYKAGRLDEALKESAMTLKEVNTTRAKFNHSMILLADGQWQRGLAEYWECEQFPPFMRPQVQAAWCAGLPQWKGEDLHDKTLLLLHAHGFGDTLMTLRYVNVLRKLGARVLLSMPKELERLTRRWPQAKDFPNESDFYCPMLHLLHRLSITPNTIDPSPYLAVDRGIVQKWRDKLGPKDRRRIGVAWSIGKPSHGDYPREIDLGQLVEHLDDGTEIHSVQSQGAERAVECGVIPHDFEDFADCAALMLCMDEIVTVDTAALHLAGAIGHPHVTGLLSHWASWRWVARWYATVRLCRQTAPDDWESALAQVYAP